MEESCKGIILFHYFVSDVLSGLWLPPLAMGNGGWRWMYFLNQIFISFCCVVFSFRFQVLSPCLSLHTAIVFVYQYCRFMFILRKTYFFHVKYFLLLLLLHTL